MMAFGAFVEILPGKEGLVHISELADYRVPSVEDVVNVGDEIKVLVTEIDRQGRINLSRRALLEPSEGRAGRGLALTASDGEDGGAAPAAPRRWLRRPSAAPRGWLRWRPRGAAPRGWGSPAASRGRCTVAAAGDDRGPRREGGDRPPRREGGYGGAVAGGERGPRREGGDRPPVVRAGTVAAPRGWLRWRPWPASRGWGPPAA